MPATIKRDPKPGKKADVPKTAQLMDENTLEITSGPIKDAKESASVSKKHFDNRQKSGKANAEVQKRMDGAKPFRLKEGESWRTNMSTRLMETLIERKAPVLMGFVDNLRYLTASKLQGSEVSSEAQEKSEKFQGAVTSTIRNWTGFRDFLYPLVLEDIVFGTVVAACLDPLEWRPRLFRNDQFAVEEESGHNVRDWPSVSFKVPFRVHELRDKILDQSSAETAGWNVTNVAKHINKATERDRGSRDLSEQARTDVDRAKANSNYATATTTAKVIDTYVQYFSEYSGKVSQYITSLDGDELFFSEDLYDSMDEAVAAFSFECGNGKFYGSIGLGRPLHGTHVAADRNFCEWLDTAYSGHLPGYEVADAKDRNKFALQVRRGFRLYIGGKPIPNQDPVDVTHFKDTHAALVSLGEQIANAYLPNQKEEGSEHRTAREIVDNARRENIQDGDTLARFFGQLFALIGMIQKRICSVENIKAAQKIFDKVKDGGMLVSDTDHSAIQKLMGEDKSLPEVVKESIPAHLDRDAVLCVLSMLRQNLTPWEVYQISRQPAAEPLGDNAAMIAQKVVALWEAFRGNSGVDQVKLLKKAAGAIGTPQLADELVLPEGMDQTIAAEATQKQLGEIVDMLALGKPVPISGRDNHPVHNQVLFQQFAEVAKSPPPTPDEKFIAGMEACLQHAAWHIDARKQQGEQGDAITQDERNLKAVAGEVARLRAAFMQHGSAVTLGASTGPAAPPPGVPAPPAAPEPSAGPTAPPQAPPEPSISAPPPGAGSGALPADAPLPAM